LLGYARTVTATIPAAVIRAAHQFGDARAVADPLDGVQLSYTELLDRVRTVARALIGDGVRPGDRVAICSPNTHHWIEAALGSLYAGAVLVPVSTRFTGTEMLDVIRRSNARALFVAGPFLGTDRLEQLWAAGGATGLRTIVRIPVEDPVSDWAELADRGAAVSVEEADTRAAAVHPDQVADILFTSGTTGTSKGAMSAHRQSLGVAAAWAECGGLGTADRYLVINPFFHSFGYKAGILACLVTGATLVPQPVFDAGRTMELIEGERITVLPGAPTLYQSLLDSPARPDHDLGSLRLAVTGAATVPVRLVERMRAELGFDSVLTAYGLTEAVVATMCRPEDDAHTIAHTCGRVVSGMAVRIAERTGEILLRGPNIMLGYLDDPAATAAAIDADGWLHTGDIGRLDERGYLTITDRLKDMYISGGFNVYPAEVEQVLARLDGLAESAVIGVPDERLGEVGKAFVIPAPGAQLSTEDIIEHCRARLANYKVPKQVEFRTELPRNPSGKILKRVLRSTS
jgi:acyl-CoA synthetase (AMP-forming)/AMP-acid ligase II